jgi:pimeloyl-ACP methyl ester carboxylesterase
MSATFSIGLLKPVAIAVALAYLGLALFALLFANRLVFPAPAPGYVDGPGLLKFTYNQRGDQVTLQYLNNPTSPWLVYYHHGNGEDLAGVRDRLEALHRAGFSVLAWDYPGYGTSDGRASERLVLQIAEQIWHGIPDSFGYAPDQIILYGRSVGGGPATYLASRQDAAGLILEGTFTSIFRVGIRVNILPWDLFDNLKHITAIRCPVLLLHGTHDETVPFRHSQQLLERAPAPKSFTWFDGGRHNNLLDAYPEIYSSSIRRFRDSLR